MQCFLRKLTGMKIDSEINLEENVDNVISRIRYVRKLNVSLVTEKHIDEVISYMNVYGDNLKVHQSGCQTLANICMDENIRRLVNEKGAHCLVLNTLKHFCDDWKLCWLACSALWNMTLEIEGRQTFPLNAVEVFLKTLNGHRDHKRIIKVVIGCLSNLCLTNSFRDSIGQPKNLQFLYNAILENTTDLQISATSAGLIANLAVSDEIADRLVEMGSVRGLKLMLIHQFADATFQRNVVAALRNCRTGNGFVKECILNQIIEELYILMEHPINEDAIGLPIVMVCNSLNASVAHRPTSFHLCSLHGFLMEFKILVQKQEIVENFMNFDCVDKSGYTLLSYAIEGGSLETIRFLILCGAKIYAQDDENLDAATEKVIVDSQNEASQNLKNWVSELYKITEALHTPLAITELIVQYIPPSAFLDE